MKKLVLSSVILAAFMSSNAQEALSAPTVAFKPTAGNVAVELGLSGGILNTATSLSSSGNTFPGLLKVRYFLADDLALRASFSFSSNSATTKVYEEDKNGKQTSNVGSQKISNSFYGANLGIEKHFTGTERLSTYIGGDLSLGLAGASLKEEKYNAGAYNEDYSKKIKGWNGIDPKDPVNGGNAKSGGFGFGLRAVTGADYYFVKKVYLGAEAGWGFFLFRNSGTKTEETIPDGTSTKTTTSETKTSGGSFTLAPQVVASVRIGYIF